ncbi:testis-expressed protein 35 isoform X2 [Dromiciops gliroides]|uniref:testis-expressed protein 35 isoform X2 n=1 Tax=Dromiciops gliroides TaxID=33562 RepID=UPI001CC7409C|nr:testis-expressed protein 35 isoform X2 [Dromiciops gliroides]
MFKVFLAQSNCSEIVLRWHALQEFRITSCSHRGITLSADRTNASYLPLQIKNHRPPRIGMETHSIQTCECKGLKQEMMLAKKGGTQDLKSELKEVREELKGKMEEIQQIKDIMDKDFDKLQELVDIMKDMQKDMDERMEVLIKLQTNKKLRNVCHVPRETAIISEFP